MSLRNFILSVIIFFFASGLDAKSENFGLSISLQDTLLSSANVSEQTDSSEVKVAYIAPYYYDPIVEIGIISRYPNFSISSGNHELMFTTGLQYYLEASLHWQWLAVGYKLGLRDYTKHSYDFTFSTILPFGIMTDLNLNRMRDYRMSRSWNMRDVLGAEVPSLYLDGVETKSISGNLEWAVNYKKYSSSSAFSQSYSEEQIVSAGSPIIGLLISKDSYSMQSGSNKQDLVKAVMDAFPLKSNELFNVSIGFGYGYNFVSDEHWIISFLDVPYLSMAKSHYNLSGSNHESWSAGFRNHFRFSCTYKMKKSVFGTSFESVNFIYPETKFMYSHSIIELKLYFALKLGEFGLKSDKIPGNKIVRFLGRFL